MVSASALRTLLFLWFLLIVGNFVTVSGLTVADFYPYGLPSKDKVLHSPDESSSRQIHLKVPINYFGVKQHDIFVSQNGLVSFRREFPYFRNQDLKSFDFSLIAPFYADVDTYNPDDPEVGNGAVYYRCESNNKLPLSWTCERRSSFVFVSLVS